MNKLQCVITLVVAILFGGAGSVVLAKALPESGDTKEAQRVYEKGAALTMDDLPRSRIQQSLRALQSPARERALQWLNSFTFNERDLDSLNLDRDGGVFYTDKAPAKTKNEVLRHDGFSYVDDTIDVFRLHSKPGSENVLYIDFDGHEIRGTAWNRTGRTLYQAMPFNLDGDGKQFSGAEKANIHEIWRQIAKDFVGYDVDVTTEQPEFFGKTTGHVIITRHIDAHGEPMPYHQTSGVAYVGVWGRYDFAYYSPALVYYDKMPRYAQHIADAAAIKLKRALWHRLPSGQTPRQFSSKNVPASDEFIPSSSIFMPVALLPVAAL